MSTPDSLLQRIKDIQSRLKELDALITGIRNNLLYHPQEAYTTLQDLQKRVDDLFSDYEDWAHEFGAATGQSDMLAFVQHEGLERKVFILNAQGSASQQMGKLSQALGLFQQALAMLGDQPSDSRVGLLVSLGTLSNQQGLFPQAENYYNQAYSEGMKRAEVDQQLLQSMDDPASQQQRSYVESTLQYTRLSNVQAQAALALCAFNRDDRAAWARYMDKAKKLAEEYKLSEMQRKLEFSEWQLRINGDATGEALSELNTLIDPRKTKLLSEEDASKIGIVLFAAEHYIAVGREPQLKMAAQLLNKVEQLAKANDLLDNLWKVRMARIELAKAQGTIKLAMEQAEAALSEAKHTHIQYHVEQALKVLIQLQIRSAIPAERAKADEHIEELNALGASDSLAEVLHVRANVLIENNAEAALQDIEKAEVCGVQGGEFFLQIQFAKVAILRKLGRKSEALQLGMEVIERYNEQLLPVEGPMFTQWQDVLKRLESLYTGMSSLIIEVNGADHTREAFELAEKGKAQLLRHQLVWSGQQVNDASKGIPGVTYEELHSLLVNESAALVMFGILESYSWVFILDPSKPEPQYHKIGLTTNMLLENKLSEAQSPETRNKLFGNLQQLSEYLLPPLRDVVEHCKVLYIVPDSQLYAVPFAALALDDGFRLIEHCALTFVPSASVLNWCRSRYEARSNHTCLALGVGSVETKRNDGSSQNIEFAPQASAIAQLNWANCELLPETATADDLLTKAPLYSVLHLACHGSVDSKSSDVLGSSSLILFDENAEDKKAYLTAKQIYNLNGRLHSELVFLNACVSANFHQGMRNEVGGFWQGFLQAGASSLIATLTLVDPLTAQPLALDFYQKWLAGDITKAEALRQAQLQMLNSQTEVPMLERAIEPYDWASHILIGYHR